MPSVCVFCGSSTGNDAAFAEAARQLAQALVQNECDVVYGGGRVGLMGVLADAVLELGGKITGVIPEALATKELLHRGTTELHVVASMHARKAKMNALADGFIALPGGYGTFEELFEMITWSQLGLHRKPIGLLNVRGFFQPLVNLVDNAVALEFIKPEQRELFIIHDDPAQLYTDLWLHKPPRVKKWIASSDS